MSEPTAFEERLRAALRRYVTGGPTEFDALGFARTVVAIEPRQHGRGRRLSWAHDLTGRRSSAPALAWLLVAALLVAALVMGAILAGAQPWRAHWQRIDLPGAAGQLNDVVASDNGYIAVGIAQGNGVVWTSHDGLAWDLLATGGALSGAELRAVARGTAGFVAVGSAVAPDAGSAQPAAWSSRDGRSWHRVDLGVGPGRLEDVACAGSRCVAVGFTEGAEIWWSEDTSSWVRAGRFAAADRPGFMPRLVNVVADHQGFVAAGTTEPGTIWTSPDGDAWELVDLPPAVLPATDWVYSMASGSGGRLVAVGGAFSLARAAPVDSAWVSSALPAPSHGAVVPPTSRSLFAASVAAAAWGFVAVGGVGEPGDPLGRGLVWTSPDGLRWSLRETGPSFAGLRLERVLRCGDALLVVATDGNGTYWTRAAADGAEREDAIP